MRTAALFLCLFLAACDMQKRPERVQLPVSGEEFSELVMGQTLDVVVARIGPPDAMQEDRFWFYNKAVGTKAKAHRACLEIKNGRVIWVSH